MTEDWPYRGSASRRCYISKEIETHVQTCVSFFCVIYSLLTSRFYDLDISGTLRPTCIKEKTSRS